MSVRGLTPKLIRAVVAELRARFFISERPGARTLVKERELLLVLAELAGRPIRKCSTCGELFPVMNDRHDVQFCGRLCRQRKAAERKRNRTKEA